MRRGDRRRIVGGWSLGTVAVGLVFALTAVGPGWPAGAADGGDPFWSGSWSFDKEPAGSAPTGFTAGGPSGGSAGIWKVEADPRSPGAPNVLVQTDPCGAPDCWRVLILDERDFDYADLGVVLRFVSGGPQGGAGLVLGAKDTDNFHAVTVDQALETLEVVRVRGGQQTVVGRRAIKKGKQPWHGLRVQKSNTGKLDQPYLEIGFDGALVLSVTDPALVSGKIGLATRGDAVAAFDTLRVMQMRSNETRSRPPAY